MRLEVVPIDKLDAESFKETDIDQLVLKHLRESVENYGILEPLHITPDYKIIDGIKRYLVAKEFGIKELYCVIHDEVKTTDEAALKRIILNRIRSKMPYHNIAENLKKAELHDNTTIIDLSRLTGVPFSALQIAQGIAKNDIPVDSDLARKLALVNNISKALSKTNIKLLDSFLKESIRFTWKQLILIRKELNEGMTIDFKHRADMLNGDHVRVGIYLPKDVYEKFIAKCKVREIDYQKKVYEMIMDFLNSA